MKLELEPVFMRGCGQGADFIVVLIGLVVIFKNQLTKLVNNIFKKITNQSNGI